MGAGSGPRISPGVILFSMTGRDASAFAKRAARVRQHARQAERRRDMKRPAGHYKIDQAKNHMRFISVAESGVNTGRL
ncbi:hypothetical protein B7486_10155 [cyanobacterium TDX16]|nr:hypothetical protein B7486_10155 [cyanobacterium TDX16]